MTPHDQGLDILVSDPSVLGLVGVVNVEREIPLYKSRCSMITDIDVLYELSDGGVAIAELKTSSGTRWLKAMQQLTIGSQYVEQRYGVRPVCFYVHRPSKRLRTIKSDSGVGFFEPVEQDAHLGLARWVNHQLLRFADRLPGNVLFYEPV
ncbi:MAG: hypothetical protein ACMXYM_03120 [Candidatus Woesearchaeota archaeon]